MPDTLEFGCDLVAATPWLNAYARSLTADPETARQLVQRALARAWDDRGAYRPGADLKSWLKRKATM